MKVLVTLPDELVAQLDGMSGKRGRSAEIVKRLQASFDGVALNSMAHPHVKWSPPNADIRPLAVKDLPRTGAGSLRLSRARSWDGSPIPERKPYQKGQKR